MTVRSGKHTAEAGTCSDLENWKEGKEGGVWGEKHSRAGHGGWPRTEQGCRRGPLAVGMGAGSLQMNGEGLWVFFAEVSLP